MGTITMKDRFLKLVETFIKREGIDKLMSYLQERTDFFTAPASTKYHHSVEEGLLQHSLEVFDWLYLENERLEKPYPMETIAIVALFHDICKVNYYKVDYRNTKDENGRWIKVPYYTVDDKLPFGHGEKSVYMLRELMKLSLDEAMAIRWHMGAYEGEQVWNTLSQAYKEFPLCLYLHIADMKSNYIKNI